MSSQDKVKKGQRKSALCGHFMAEWDDHHYCPKCRDDVKGDDPCVKSSDCTICCSFSDEQKGKLVNRNRYKSKKTQNSAALVDNGGKEGGIDDSLLDEDDASVSSITASNKSRSLEDKLDRFFSEFANLSQRIQNLEHKDSETVGSRISSGRDSCQVAKQPLANSKPSSSSATSAAPARLEKRSSTITRAEFDRQSVSGLASDESGVSRKRSHSESSEEPDPDLEQGEIHPKEEDSPGYTETLNTIKKWLDLEVKNVECFVPPVFSSRDQVKKSVQQSMALPPAQPLVELWKYKEFSALGSNDVDDNDPHHPPLSKGHFLSFPKPQMKFYQVSPQSFSLTAPRIQDAFKNIAASPFQAPSLVSTPLKQYLAWETVSRENIQILNHVFCFK